MDGGRETGEKSLWEIWVQRYRGLFIHSFIHSLMKHFPRLQVRNKTVQDMQMHEAGPTSGGHCSLVGEERHLNK